MFSVLKLLKAETPLSISPGLKKGREAQKYEEKTVQENFHFKKMQPPPSSQTPSSRHHGNSPLLSHKMKGDSSCQKTTTKNLICIAGSGAPPFLTNTSWNYKDNSATIGAVPEQEGLRVWAAFISAHVKLCQGMSDTARKVI